MGRTIFLCNNLAMVLSLERFELHSLLSILLHDSNKANRN